jgi:anti-sigma-K factor RskA
MRIEQHDIPTIADEYVLGLLNEAEMVAVEAEIERNETLRQAVAQARERFLPLDAGIVPIDVSPALWTEIQSRLPTHAAAHVASAPLQPPAGNDNVRSGWRMTAISAIATSLFLAVGLIWSVARTIEPLVVAVLVNEAGEVQAVVEDFGNDTAQIRLLADFVIPADKTMQVWTLPSQDMGPMSLGLLEHSHSARLSGWSLPKPKDAQLYEITLEQSGGSPTNRPTGAILAKGFAKLPR